LPVHRPAAAQRARPAGERALDVAGHLAYCSRVDQRTDGHAGLQPVPDARGPHALDQQFAGPVEHQPVRAAERLGAGRQSPTCAPVEGSVTAER
jgi:hypothetical protein